MATKEPTRSRKLSPHQAHAQAPEAGESWSTLLASWRALSLYGNRWNHASDEAASAATLTRKLAHRSRELAEVADEWLADGGGPLADFAADLDKLAVELRRTNGPWSGALPISGDVDDKKLGTLAGRAEAAQRRHSGEQADPRSKPKKGDKAKAIGATIAGLVNSGVLDASAEDVANHAGCTASFVRRQPVWKRYAGSGAAPRISHRDVANEADPKSVEHRLAARAAGQRVRPRPAD